MKQIVAHKKLGGVQGLLLVLALVALLVLINYVAIELLARYIGYTAASVGFWVLGCLVAWYVLRVYVVNIVYELTGDVLRISRKYGKRERHIEDIYLNKILFVGNPADARRRWPEARHVNAVHSGNKLPAVAVVYQNSVGTRMALMQVNPEIRAKLVERVKSR